jgi:transglutaminase-like putative cysteine protease
MAGMDWARARPQTAPAETIFDRLPKVDWEFVFTIALCLGAATAVSTALEDGGWSKDMPPLTIVVVIGLISAAVLAKSRMTMFMAWPIGIVLGAAVVLWQTMLLVGPGSLETRVNAIYTRFDAWFHVAFGSGVTNDQLPFNVLILSLAWLGVFLFAWSVVRWHNAWIGLIPGGAVIFLDLVLVGDDLTGTILLYMLLGFLLVMQTNLNALLKRWREENIEYPAFINISFFHFSLWALIAIMIAAWIVPVGPYNTPQPVQAVIDGTLERGADLVRLAGPLRTKKIIPIHSYSGTLTFDGSISLGDRELMAVTITDPSVRGGMLLRGTVYDDYEGGGWQIGDRTEVEIPEGTTDEIVAQLNALSEEEAAGTVVPLHIEMLAKSVVGTVIFSPGTPIEFDRTLTIDIPEDAVSSRAPIGRTSPAESDDTIFSSTLKDGEIPVRVVRDSYETPIRVEFIDLETQGLTATAEIDPGSRVKRYRTYDVTGLIPEITAQDLRNSESGETPFWIDRTYTTLPTSVPQRVRDLAEQTVGDAGTQYDKVIAIQQYLRQFPVDYNIGATPPGQDTVDYFLNDVRRGYFNYHASAMVVMLRSAEVPARLAVGFAVDDSDFDAESGVYIVRDDNSYAWAEVYFADYGWVAFNPSPDRPATIEPTEVDPGDPLSGIDPDLLDNLPVSAFEGALEPGEGVDIPLRDGGDGPANVISPDGGESYEPWLLMAVLGFAGAVFIAVSFGWGRSVAGLPYPQQMWEKTVRLASWGGFKPQPGQTPHEYVAALSRRHRGIRNLDVLATTYTGSRFGKKEVSETDRERLGQMWPSLRGALIGGIVRRIIRLGKKRG